MRSAAYIRLGVGVSLGFFMALPFSAAADEVGLQGLLGECGLYPAECEVEDAQIWDAVVTLVSMEAAVHIADFNAAMSEQMAFREGTAMTCGPEPTDLPRDETLKVAAGRCWSEAFARRTFDLLMTEKL